tara:strand:+ start:415 stop:912 length:498 start_codon:yes stop_codon:yes gene_type:complete
MSFILYMGGSAAAYWLGSNLIMRTANSALDWVLNKDAIPDIKETHTLNSILSLIKAYDDLPESHPAYGAYREVQNGLRDLQTAIERARLRFEAHKGGYLTRFRTFDASYDNAIIERVAQELIKRLDLFTSLIGLEPIATRAATRAQSHLLRLSQSESSLSKSKIL